MRYLWVDAGNDPAFDVGSRHGIDGYFMPMFDGRTTRQALQAVAARGYACGLYLGHGWLTGTPEQVAAKVRAEYTRVAVPALRVQVNLEQHDPVWIAATLRELRRLHPGVGLSWTLEGMQGGWAHAVASTVAECRVRTVPQGFYGAAGRIDGQWAADMVLRDLLRVGYAESAVSLFYDAAVLPRGWQGYAFTQGRLA